MICAGAISTPKKLYILPVCLSHSVVDFSCCCFLVLHQLKQSPNICDIFGFDSLCCQDWVWQLLFPETKATFATAKKSCASLFPSPPPACLFPSPSSVIDCISSFHWFHCPVAFVWNNCALLMFSLSSVSSCSPFSMGTLLITRFLLCPAFFSFVCLLTCLFSWALTLFLHLPLIFVIFSPSGISVSDGESVVKAGFFIYPSGVLYHKEMIMVCRGVELMCSRHCSERVTGKTVQWRRPGAPSHSTQAFRKRTI